MATYIELRNLANNADLRNRIEVAVMVAAEAIITASPADTDERVGWAQRVLSNPAPWAQRVLWLALASNKDASAAQISGATDAALQTIVDGAVSALAKGSVLGG